MTIKPFTFKIGRLRLLSYFVFGLGICLVSTIAGKDAEVNLDESAWVLPIVAISTALGRSTISSYMRKQTNGF